MGDKKQKGTAVVFITDDNYALPTLVAVTSIVENKREDSVLDVYIVSDGMSAENEALFAALSLDGWRVSGEEGLNALKEALGEDADGMKLFVAQSLEALLALREYGERGIGRGIFTATMEFLARFSVVFWEEDSPAFRDWIFPTAVTAPVEDLPEATSLQRAVKRHLLAGGKIGWAEGYWKG